MISVVIVGLVLVKPLFIDKQKTYYQSEPDHHEFNELLSILETISDLETDYKMGKLSKEDFDAMSLDYKRTYLEKKKQISA